jgi:mono/diheme cytochrome c family protein
MVRVSDSAVKGRPFTGVMPPLGASLSDAQIAAVVTYVRSQWGNHSPAVTESQVKAVRAATTAHAGPWTADELKKLM